MPTKKQPELEFGALGTAARSGDQLDSLLKLRDLLADQMDTTQDARSAAALSRQFTDVLDRIENLGGQGKAEAATPLDKLSAMRGPKKK